MTKFWLFCFWFCSMQVMHCGRPANCQQWMNALVSISAGLHLQMHKHSNVQMHALNMHKHHNTTEHATSQYSLVYKSYPMDM